MTQTMNEPCMKLREWMEASNTSQTELADITVVSRTAVSKWCAGAMFPSEENAKIIERYSGGCVPATIWHRRRLPEPQTKGARALRKVAKKRKITIFELSRQCGLSERGMHRWACSLNAPRPKSIAKINAALGLNLRLRDFGVMV